MSRLISWTVVVLCAVGIGVIPIALIGRHSEWFADHVRRSVGVGVIEIVLFVTMWTQVRRLRGMGKQ